MNKSRWLGENTFRPAVCCLITSQIRTRCYFCLITCASLTKVEYKGWYIFNDTRSLERPKWSLFFSSSDNKGLSEVSLRIKTNVGF